MSLATRCSACDTVFRVVQDQLKVSEGWVRCGRCQAVFNALEGLFDLESAPAVGAPVALTDEPIAVAASRPGPTLEPQHEQADSRIETRPGDRVDAEPGLGTTPASRVAQRDRLAFADAQFNHAMLAEAGVEVAEPPVAIEPPAAPEILLAEPDADAPEFLRLAERQAKRDRPRNRVALWLLGVLLMLALALQAALHFRDLLAALLPPLRPALEALCEVAACMIEPPRRIDDVVIESSALTSTADGDAVRLAVVLRNRGPLALAMPSIELTLTDAGGQMLARRALSPADFAVKSALLPAASETALQLVLSLGERRASGYTVEPFYP